MVRLGTNRFSKLRETVVLSLSVLHVHCQRCAAYAFIWKTEVCCFQQRTDWPLLFALWAKSSCAFAICKFSKSWKRYVLFNSRVELTVLMTLFTGDFFISGCFVIMISLQLFPWWINCLLIARVKKTNKQMLFVAHFRFRHLMCASLLLKKVVYAWTCCVCATYCSIQKFFVCRASGHVCRASGHVMCGEQFYRWTEPIR